MHLRAEIKKAVFSMLIEKTNAGTHIYPARYSKVPEVELPAICIFTPLEVIAKTDDSTDERACTVNVECLTCDEDGEADLDALSNQAENALAVDITLGGIVKSLRLKKIVTGEDPAADRDILTTIMTYEAIYHTDSFYNGSFDDLKTITADYGGRASDTIDLTEKGGE